MDVTASTSDPQEKFCASGSGLTPLIWAAPTGRFHKGHLTYRVHLTGSHHDLLAAIANAFRAWSYAYRPFFAFRPARQNEPDADIDVDFTLQFDSKFPRRQGTGALNATTQRAVISVRNTLEGNPWTGVELFPLVLHEIGHALGLQHSNEPWSVMYPFYGMNWPPHAIDDETKQLLRDLYGWQLGEFPEARVAQSSPALAVTGTPTTQAHTWDETVHMVWLSIVGAPTLWYSDSNDHGSTWGAPRRLTAPEHAGPDFGVALAASSRSRNTLALAWAGRDRQLWFCPDVTWPLLHLEPRKLEGHSSDARPALAICGDQMYLAWKSNGDSRVWWSVYSQGAWAAAQALYGAATEFAPALAASDEQVVLTTIDAGRARAWVLRPKDGPSWAELSMTTFAFEAAEAPEPGDPSKDPPPVTHTVTAAEPFESANGCAVSALGGEAFLFASANRRGELFTLRYAGIANGVVPIEGAVSPSAPALAVTVKATVCVWVGDGGRLMHARSETYIPDAPAFEMTPLPESPYDIDDEFVDPEAKHPSIDIPGSPYEPAIPGGVPAVPEELAGSGEFDRLIERERPDGPLSRGIRSAGKFDPNK